MNSADGPLRGMIDHDNQFSEDGLRLLIEQFGFLSLKLAVKVDISS